MFSSSSEHRLKGPERRRASLLPFLSTLKPFCGFSLGCGGYQEGSAFTSHRDTEKLLKENKKEKMSKCVCVWMHVCTRVFRVQPYSNPICGDKVCQSSRSATAKDNTHTHTYTLKMEVRDQSSDGQVEGGEWKISDGLRTGNRDQGKELCCGLSEPLAWFETTPSMFS